MDLQYPLYDVVHLSLGTAYIIMAIVCAANIYRIFRRRTAAAAAAQQHKNSLYDNMFYPLALLGSLLRATFFCLQPLIRESMMRLPNAVNFFMNTLPSFVFFATYLIIMFRWAEIYHNSYEISSLKVRHLQRILLWTIGGMFSIVGLLYGLDFVIYPSNYKTYSKPMTVIEIIILWWDVSLFLLTPIGFLFYGVMLSRKVYQMPTRSSALLTYCERIQKFTAFVCVDFAIRSAVITYTIIHDHDVSKVWWFDGVYYFGLEIVPLVVMLYILRMHPRNKKDAPVTSVTPLINSAYTAT